MTKLKERLKMEEGLSVTAYPDPLSPLGRECARRHIDPRKYRTVPGWQNLAGDPWTCGYGHTGPDINKDTLWTPEQADAALDADIAKHRGELLHALPWVAGLDPVRADVLVDMAFNMGVLKLLKFVNTLALVHEGKYVAAAQNMLKSLWAQQVGGRAKRLARIMSSGVDE